MIEKKLIWKNGNHSSGMLSALAEESAGPKVGAEADADANKQTESASSNSNDNDFYFTTGVSASLPVDDEVQVGDQSVQSSPAEDVEVTESASLAEKKDK